MVVNSVAMLSFPTPGKALMWMMGNGLWGRRSSRGLGGIDGFEGGESIGNDVLWMETVRGCFCWSPVAARTFGTRNLTLSKYRLLLSPLCFHLSFFNGSVPRNKTEDE